MVSVISITVPPEGEHDEGLIKAEAARLLRCPQEAITALRLQKRSVDARRGRPKLVLRYAAYMGDAPPDEVSPGLPAWKPAVQERRAVIVGAGPAGLFAGLRLLEDGIKPVVVEQGKRAPERRRDIAAIGAAGLVDAHSNYCFGEGGAGAFSDGKLFSRSKKRGDTGRILAILRHFGADASILSDSHPHIGTDRLPAIITAITDKIISLGGEFLFQTQCIDFTAKDGRVTGVRARRLTDGAVFDIAGGAVILAAGHSAGGIYGLVQSAAARIHGGPGFPAALEAKTFACGVRVEHPRRLIDAIQFRAAQNPGGLGAAEYWLKAQVEGRGVYSFCMCPGGVIVPAASGPGEIVVNGMSPSKRNTRWSNAGIVVETRREDCAAFFDESGEETQPDGGDPLVSLRFREAIEKRAAQEGQGQKAPAQRLTDFLAGRMSATLPESSYLPAPVPSRLDLWLPHSITDRLKKAFSEFNRSMRGFISAEALLVAPETRTSSPVRILRNANNESAALPGLFPCGEGSGYSGGIVSSAIDGEKTAASVAAIFRP